MSPSQSLKLAAAAMPVLRGTELQRWWMNAVTIHDTRQVGGITVLAYDLADLLALAGPEAQASVWTLAGVVEALGPGAEELHLAAEAGPVTGARLAELAAGVTQTIEGTFEATRPGESRPWLVLKAIDGCYFIVISSNCELMSQVRRRFCDVRPSPEDSEQYAERRRDGPGGD
jgi:hypothetical protein